jgi:hypothetical protein
MVSNGFVRLAARIFAPHSIRDATKGKNTYSYVWIIGQDIFMGRGGLPLGSGRRGRLGLQGGIPIHLMKEL